MTKARRSTTTPTPSERKGSVWVTSTDPHGPATATTVRPESVPKGYLANCPWPDGDEKAAGNFIPPKPEWRRLLERWLLDHHWGDEIDPKALATVLMGEPFNLSHERFNRRLTIDRAMEYLKRKAPVARLAELHAAEDEDALLALTASQELVITTLAQSDRVHLLSVKSICGAMDPRKPLSARTIGPIVHELIDLNLAERPKGVSQGTRLTNAGRRLAANIAD